MCVVHKRTFTVNDPSGNVTETPGHKIEIEFRYHVTIKCSDAADAHPYTVDLAASAPRWPTLKATRTIDGKTREYLFTEDGKHYQCRECDDGALGIPTPGSWTASDSPNQ